MTTSDKSLLVAACGLYCGNCYKYKKGKCPGCAENTKAGWCKIRTCESKKGQTCAGCSAHDEINDCKQFNNIFAKIFSFIFRSDRRASLERIKEVGESQYAEEMETRGKMVYEK